MLNMIGSEYILTMQFHSFRPSVFWGFLVKVSERMRIPLSSGCATCWTCCGKQFGHQDPIRWRNLWIDRFSMTFRFQPVPTWTLPSFPHVVAVWNLFQRYEICIDLLKWYPLHHSTCAITTQESRFPVICAFAASTACNCNCRCLQELGVAKVGSRLNKRCLHLLEDGKCYLFVSTEKCSSRTRHQLYWTEIAGSIKPTNGWQIWEDCELSASVNLLRHTNRLFFLLETRGEQTYANCSFNSTQNGAKSMVRDEFDIFWNRLFHVFTWIVSVQNCVWQRWYSR